MFKPRNEHVSFLFSLPSKQIGSSSSAESGTCLDDSKHTYSNDFVELKLLSDLSDISTHKPYELLPISSSKKKRKRKTLNIIDRKRRCFNYNIKEKYKYIQNSTKQSPKILANKDIFLSTTADSSRDMTVPEQFNNIDNPPGSPTMSTDSAIDLTHDKLYGEISYKSVNDQFLQGGINVPPSLIQSDDQFSSYSLESADEITVKKGLSIKSSVNDAYDALSTVSLSNISTTSSYCTANLNTNICAKTVAKNVGGDTGKSCILSCLEEDIPKKLLDKVDTIDLLPSKCLDKTVEGNPKPQHLKSPSKTSAESNHNIVTEGCKNDNIPKPPTHRKLTNKQRLSKLSVAKPTVTNVKRFLKVTNGKRFLKAVISKSKKCETSPVKSPIKNADKFVSEWNSALDSPSKFKSASPGKNSPSKFQSISTGTNSPSKFRSLSTTTKSPSKFVIVSPSKKYPSKDQFVSLNALSDIDISLTSVSAFAPKSVSTCTTSCLDWAPDVSYTSNILTNVDIIKNSATAEHTSHVGLSKEDLDFHKNEEIFKQLITSSISEIEEKPNSTKNGKKALLMIKNNSENMKTNKALMGNSFQCSGNKSDSSKDDKENYFHESEAVKQDDEVTTRNAIPICKSLWKGKNTLHAATPEICEWKEPNKNQARKYAFNIKRKYLNLAKKSQLRDELEKNGNTRKVLHQNIRKETKPDPRCSKVRKLNKPGPKSNKVGRKYLSSSSDSNDSGGLDNSSSLSQCSVRFNTDMWKKVLGCQVQVQDVDYPITENLNTGNNAIVTDMQDTHNETQANKSLAVKSRISGDTASENASQSDVLHVEHTSVSKTPSDVCIRKQYSLRSKEKEKMRTSNVDCSNSINEDTFLGDGKNTEGILQEHVSTRDVLQSTPISAIHSAKKSLKLDTDEIDLHLQANTSEKEYDSDATVAYDESDDSVSIIESDSSSSCVSSDNTSSVSSSDSSVGDSQSKSPVKKMIMEKSDCLNSSDNANSDSSDGEHTDLSDGDNYEQVLTVSLLNTDIIQPIDLIKDDSYQPNTDYFSKDMQEVDQLMLNRDLLSTGVKVLESTNGNAKENQSKYFTSKNSMDASSQDTSLSSFVNIQTHKTTFQKDQDKQNTPIKEVDYFQDLSDSTDVKSDNCDCPSEKKRFKFKNSVTQYNLFTEGVRSPLPNKCRKLVRRIADRSKSSSDHRTIFSKCKKKMFTNTRTCTLVQDSNNHDSTSQSIEEKKKIHRPSLEEDMPCLNDMNNTVLIENIVSSNQLPIVKNSTDSGSCQQAQEIILVHSPDSSGHNASEVSYQTFQESNVTMNTNGEYCDFTIISPYFKGKFGCESEPGLSPSMSSGIVNANENSSSDVLETDHVNEILDPIRNNDIGIIDYNGITSSDIEVSYVGQFDHNSNIDDGKFDHNSNLNDNTLQMSSTSGSSLKCDVSQRSPTDLNESIEENIEISNDLTVLKNGSRFIRPALTNMVMRSTRLIVRDDAETVPYILQTATVTYSNSELLCEDVITDSSTVERTALKPKADTSEVESSSEDTSSLFDSFAVYLSSKSTNLSMDQSDSSSNKSDVSTDTESSTDDAEGEPEIVVNLLRATCIRVNDSFHSKPKISVKDVPKQRFRYASLKKL